MPGTVKAGKKAITVGVVEQIHPQLPPMQRASRTGRLYTGPCPFCADGGDDRFHVWMAASGKRPAERYWCRVCNRRGLLRNLGREDAAPEPRRIQCPPAAAHTHPARAEPDPAHIPYYRALYEATALWAHSWMLDGCHPDPQRYLHQRGLSDTTIRRSLLGVTLNDPNSLVAYLRTTCIAISSWRSNGRACRSPPASTTCATAARPS